MPTWRASQARGKRQLKNQTLEFGIKFTNKQFTYLRRLGVDAAGEIRCVLTVGESRKKQTGLGGKEWEILFHALPSPARHHFGQLHLEPDLAAKVDKFRGF